ncbi:helicase [Rhodococcus sp. BP-349]|uniref:helicase-related protein n=1 Tax=unclassified Rhodococcus (in: high G+C Gram-positive bacteria) TaxID=192944 RepID=UPI001C9AFE3F|nr:MULTISPECIES: helicase-related protein [unclassified Rhodococcus (in: high G+C Gram-positive bacteria)]MBY6540051.1 helicase [Rhodococcus sp. BP-363]MBY6543621.1 helicase [Rhodococcus sp. BP-369]MBY6562851.1 helicase [Rhodococcus sp. BP-370]MBY6577143.1 helicase [Rhodococcus sp. BP-364]MBY6586444.1 helicase [Rhodococcus sp. BP-358]
MAEDLAPWYRARDDIFDSLEDELLGPADGPLSEFPLNRIIVGILHPQKPHQAIATEYHEKLEADEPAEDARSASLDSSATESAVARSHAHRPSAMGLTFSVDSTKTTSVIVDVMAHRYEEQGDGSWLPIRVATDHPVELDPLGPHQLSAVVAENLLLRGVVRDPVDGVVRMTLSLVNTNVQSAGEGHDDAACWFRPSITVATANGKFVDRRRPRDVASSDPDVRSSEFLYRDEPALAIGHGCAVSWDETATDVTHLRTTFLPSHDVRLARPSGGDDDDPFGSYQLVMNDLASSDDRTHLSGMASAYERWIEAREADSGLLAGPAREAALEHIDMAAVCARRMRAGIEALEDPLVNRAFRLMNEAMVAQRDAQDKARGEAPSTQKWRPFQLAFILMNIPGIVDPTHDDRDVVDLLWFPTGGGKTEAYLGCIALTVLLRRLRRADDGGVSAIMRYTLRLLTRQQFERAAGLICALELIRRRDLPKSKEITLGLWVGDKASPNKVEDAKAILDKYASGEQPEGSTPVQLLRCPWCSAELGHRNYHIVNKSELVIRCPNYSCEFSDGLPCFVTDDDVYRVRPSLVIGTVDKFALMTWRSRVGSLLSVDGPDSRPDLIVQDELHLISGPLGTMAGLYESALDLACTDAGRPKVLASTATIRRAQQQVKRIFDRNSVQFPPPGLNPSDNYFAVDATPEQKGSRRYVGVMAPGTSQATLLVRLYSVLLQSVSELEAPDAVRDDYWTLLGYFNSLRVLGSTYLQVLDDVPDRLRIVAARHRSEARVISQEPVELTSRVDQTKIPTAMGKLETSYPSPDSPDVVLATNMISVGLDIDRLGLMVVAGQPQSSSEYIQSTSRVGRRHPGLVIVALNAQRSRDSSHYESFIPFHRALYREVEATTATPFASRARDRGAHGTLVAAIRLLIPGLRDDNSAVAIAKYPAETRKIVDALVARAERVAPDEYEAYRDQLLTYIKIWEEAAERELIDEYGKLTHPRASRQTARKPLLASTSGNSQPASYPVREPAWPTLSSMRDVDAETQMFEKYLAREAQ